MTCCSSLNSGSILKVRLRFEFGGQELPNDVCNFIVRRRENRLWYMVNQTDGSSTVPYNIGFTGQNKKEIVCAQNQKNSADGDR